MPRRIAAISTALVLLVGVGFGTASTAAAAEPAARTTTVVPTPPAPTPQVDHLGHYVASAYAAQAAKLPSTLVTAISRDLKISGSEFLADSAAAVNASAVVAQLKTAGVHVLGSSIHGTAVTVNVASSADTAAVTAVGATAVIGAPAAAPKLTKPLKTAVARMAQPATTPVHGGDGYWFEDGQYDYQCSVGFNGHAISNGANQFVSAGHCFNDVVAPIESHVNALNYTTPQGFTTEPAVDVIGDQSSYPANFGGNSGDDDSLVDETGTGVVPGNDVREWSGSTTLPIYGQASATVGAAICKSGSRTGYTCGTVKAVDQDLDIQDQNPVTGVTTDNTVNAIVTNVCVLPGDSGGAGVIGNFAVGITSGSSFDEATDNTCVADSSSVSAFFTMVSAASKASVASTYGSHWEIGVTLAAPVITSPSSGGNVSEATGVTGTVANAAPGDNLSVVTDGTGAATVYPLASNGVFKIPTAGLAPGTHSFAIKTTYGSWSASTTTTISFVVPTSITGTIHGTNGHNLAGWVDVYKAGGAGPVWATLITTQPVTANADNAVNFSIGGLPVGSYVIAFTDSPAKVDANGGPPPSNPDVTTYYSGEYTYASANTISVATFGTAVTGITMSVENPTFADVSDPTYSLYPDVQWMASTGISTGTAQPSGKPLYLPSAAVSRQAMASFLYKLSGNTTFVPPADPTFADVDSSSQFYKPIEWMYAQQISTGTVQPSGKPLFKPADPVSRQSMALFLARYDHVDLSTPPTTQVFADVPITASSAAAITWMANEHISTGTANPPGLPLYKPADPVSRSAMAAFLYRLAHLPA